MKKILVLLACLLMAPAVFGAINPEYFEPYCVDSGGEWEDNGCICSEGTVEAEYRCWHKTPTQACEELGGIVPTVDIQIPGPQIGSIRCYPDQNSLEADKNKGYIGLDSLTELAYQLASGKCAGPGEEVDPQQHGEGIKCCEGLEEIVPGRWLFPCSPESTVCESGCSVVPPYPVPWVQCAPCGNGICEPEYGENKCNCGADCVEEKQNGDEEQQDGVEDNEGDEKTDGNGSLSSILGRLFHWILDLLRVFGLGGSS